MSDIPRPEPITPLYVEQGPSPIILTDSQKQAVRDITLGIAQVDERVRIAAQEDVIATLQNGNPLNRLFQDENGKVKGYMACQDFGEGQAYLKYFGTLTGSTDRNLLRKISAFLDFARESGYKRLSFHGWNDRLNQVMVRRFGFNRIRRDTYGDLGADFFEVDLTNNTPSEPGAKTSRPEITEEIKEAFKKKQLARLSEEYQATVDKFPKDERVDRESFLSQAYSTLSTRLSTQEGFTFGELQQAILRLKLARHFQQNDTLDLNSLFDAIIESPGFMKSDRGSLHRLLEVHEIKTLEKIAEIRKRRAEIKGDEVNPFEALLTAKSEKYYLARLLNMPHLEKESEYMANCVGTSDSYANRIKNGDIEILSFRRVPQFNPRTGRWEGDEPVITIEYDLRAGKIEQIKKKGDEYLSPEDSFVEDLFDVLKRLKDTHTDNGKPRIVRNINESELTNFDVKDGYLLTDRGEVHFRDVDPEDAPFVLKFGRIDIDSDFSRQDSANLIRISEGIVFSPDEIARYPSEINEYTKAYVGKLDGIFDKIRKFNIEHVYTSFPEGRIRFDTVTIGGKSNEELQREMKDSGINISEYVASMMKNPDFTTLSEPRETNLVRLKVGELGLPDDYPTTEQIFKRAEELGLELCPPDLGPNYRLAYKDQPMNGFSIGMKPITDSGGVPWVFHLEHTADGLWLLCNFADPGNRWNPRSGFVFSLPKSS